VSTLKCLEGGLLTVHSQTEPNNVNTSVHTDVTRMLTENRWAFIRFLSGRLGSPDIAEEVLQEFYVRALSKSSAIKKRESIPQWLHRVLRSTLADFYRAKAARRNVEKEYSHVQPGVVLDHVGKDPEAMCACLG
jgi:RNA polymerase sigma-70 factor (ECF subfamily)